MLQWPKVQMSTWRNCCGCKKAAHAHKPQRTEATLLEWAEIISQPCQTLIKPYRHLHQPIAVAWFCKLLNHGVCSVFFLNPDCISICLAGMPTRHVRICWCPHWVTLQTPLSIFPSIWCLRRASASVCVCECVCVYIWACMHACCASSTCVTVWGNSLFSVSTAALAAL